MVLPSEEQRILGIKSNINTRNKKATKERFKKVVEEVVSDNVREIKKEVVEIVKNEEVRKDKVKMQWSDNKKVENWEMVIKRATNYEMRIRRAATKQFDRQLEEILKYKKKKAVLPSQNRRAWELDIDREKAIWHRIFLPIIMDIVGTEGQIGLSSVTSGLYFSASDAVRRFIDNSTMKFSWEVNRTTNKRIRKILNDNPFDNEVKIGRKIRKEFEHMTPIRAKMIARTETFKASNYAHEEGYRQSGVVEAKEWFTALDERVCPACYQLEGKKIGLGRVFIKRGGRQVIDGTNYPANYESIKNPPRHPDCRCRIVPVVVGLKEYNKIIKLKKQDQAQEAKDIEIKKLQNELDEKEKEQGKQFSKVNKELKDIKEMNEKELGKIAEDVKDLLNE